MATTELWDLYFALDDDDPTGLMYPEKRLIGKSNSAVEALNRAAIHLQTDYEYIGFIGDDNRAVSPGWDERILAALEEQGGGVVYPNDLVIPGSLPSTVFMSTAICRAVGYFALPGLRINYFDNVWQDLGRGLGKYRYLPEVAIQHLTLPHWWATKEQGERHEAQVLVDRQTYLDWTQSQRQADVALASLALPVSA